MTNEEIIGNLPSTETPYSPVQSQSPGSLDRLYNQSAYASRPTSQFTNELNANVASKSNLLGPSHPNDPQADAMSARSRQIYNSSLNGIMKSAEPIAVDRQIRLQQQDTDNRADVYRTAQSRSHLNFQQVAKQREFAITQEAIRRELISSIFQGVGTIGGMFAAKGLYNATHQNPKLDSGNTSAEVGFSDVNVDSNTTNKDSLFT